MRLTTTALAAFFMASTAMAGQFDLGGELNAERNVDQSITTAKVTPELTWTQDQLELTASSILNLYNDGFVISDTLDVLPTIDLGAEYDLTDTLELYGTVSYDLEAEARGDVKVGVTYSF